MTNSYGNEKVVQLPIKTVANFVMFQTGSVTSRGIYRNFLIAQSSKNMEKYELLRFVLSLVDRCV